MIVEHTYVPTADELAAAYISEITDYLADPKRGEPEPPTAEIVLERFRTYTAEVEAEIRKQLS